MTFDCVEFCRAMSDETRQGILKLLQVRGELCVSDIVAAFNASQPTISHHLGVLKNVGLVKSHKEGKMIYYSLDQENVQICCGMLMIKFVPEPDKVIAELIPS